MKYLISVFMGAISYGVLSTIVVLAYKEGFQLGEIVGTQLLTGFVLSWLLVFYTKKKESRELSKRNGGASANWAHKSLTWKQRILLMLAGTPTVITGLLYYQSLRYISASIAIILLFQFTWISVIIQTIYSRCRPGKNIVLALLVIFGGTFFASGLSGGERVSFNSNGIILALLAAVSYSLFILFSGKVLPTVHPVYRNAWMITGGFILLVILFPPYFLFNGLLWGPLLIFGFLLGLFGAFIPPLLFAIGVPHIGEGMAGILGAAELPVAVLLSSLVLHEHVDKLQWLGVILILAGVVLPKLQNLQSKK